MTFGSLFAGIGGMDLGLERAGMECRWQVEIDPYCQRVLTKHWPDVPKYKDVRDVGRHNLEPVDLICGGFPCQPVSQAAARSARSDGWLWPAFARIVEELRPRFAVVENPAALRYSRRGLADILGDLSAIGYDAVWSVLRASDLGAPHLRARLWLVAYPNCDRQPDLSFHDEAFGVQESCGSDRAWSDPPGGVAVANGIPATVALRMYGNAVVPQVAEWIGRRIMTASEAPC